jgi:MFS family permease
MSWLVRFFGLEGATKAGLHLARTIAVLGPAFAATFQISTTFWMIFIAERLGGGDYIAGLTKVGFLVVVQLLIQVFLDYPTGAVGDWIGQRWIIASAMLCYGAAYWLTSFATPESPFEIFLTIYVLMGLGSAQESGAFPAWFDNNYRVAMPHDIDRKQYGVFQGKLAMIWQAVSTAVLLPGAWLALAFQRTWVFQLQAGLSVILAVLVLIVVRDLPGVRESLQHRPTLRQYGGLLKDGMKFLVSSRFIGFVMLGEVLMWATGTLWWSLLLFPLYFTYLITDIAVSGFRTSIFLPQVFLNERSGVWARRFNPAKWIPRMRLLQFGGFIFYVLLSLCTLFFPAPPASSQLVNIYVPFTNLIYMQIPLASVLPVVLIFSIFLFSTLFETVSGILLQRVMIDVVPTRIRNSLYSLRPTLAMSLAVPMLAFFGFILPLYRFPLTFALAGLLALLGFLATRKGFSYPIPRIPSELETSEKAQKQ